MTGTYKVYWTTNALNELEQTIKYLEDNFTDKELRKLALKIETTSELISQNPFIFPKSEFKDVYRAVLLKYNTLYYRIRERNIEILSFYSNRQSPKKRKI